MNTPIVRERMRVLLALALLVALACCSPRPATQIVVRIDADPLLVADLERVTVTAFLEGQESRPILGDAGYELTQYTFPGDVVIAAADADEARRLVVRVTGVTRASSLVQRAIVAFRKEETLLLSIFLARQCLTANCEPTLTCGNDGLCREVDRPAVGPIRAADAATDRSVARDGVDDLAADVAEAGSDATDAGDVSDVGDAMDTGEADVVGADARVDAMEAGGACPAGFADCDRSAANGCETNLLSASSCGGCGRMCEGGAVFCAPADGGAACVGVCPSGLATCGSVCTSTRTDARHCGACSNRCATGEGCVEGVCVCQAPYMRCGGRCVDVRSDVEHCGTCGRPAGMLQGCAGGELVPVQPTQIAMNETVCVRMSDATVRCWGSNRVGEIDASGMDRLSPVRLPFRDVARVYVFRNAVCALFNDHTARCQGSAIFERFAITSSPGLVALGIGANFGCGVFTDGSVHCRGVNDYGQLGAGDTRVTYANPVLARPMTVGADQLHALNYSVCVRMLSGRLRCWGRNVSGQLGNGTGTDVYLPTELALTGVESLGSQGGEVSGAHRCARLETGSLVCWGDNMSGQLGYGDTSVRLLASGVVPDTAGVVDFTVGQHGTLARTATRSALQWGHVRAGGSGVSQTRPMAIAGLSDVSGIAGDYWATCVLRGAEVLCWGYNDYGQLGDGTNVRRDTPAPVRW